MSNVVTPYTPTTSQTFPRSNVGGQTQIQPVSPQKFNTTTHSSPSSISTQDILIIGGAALGVGALGVGLLLKRRSAIADTSLVKSTQEHTQALEELIRNDDESRLAYYTTSAKEWKNPQSNKLRNALEIRTDKNTQDHYYTVMEKKKPVGIISITQIKDFPGHGNLAYWFTKNRKPGTGLATRMVNAAVARVFKNDKRMDSIVAVIQRGNAPSHTLINGKDMKFHEVTETQPHLLTGFPNNCQVYMTKREDWKSALSHVA